MKTNSYILSLTLLAAACGFAQEINLFALPRDAPMRRVDEPPASAKPGQAMLESVARAGEYHVFQLGVVAGDEPLGTLRITFADLQGKEMGIPAAAMECLSLGGIGNDGLPFTKEVVVPAGGVQVMWCGVQVPATARGTFEGSARLAAAGKPVGTYTIRLRVDGEPVDDHGDSEARHLSRLRWLNSTVGSEDTITRPFVPVKVADRTVRVLGRELEIGRDGLPVQARSHFNDANTALIPDSRPLLDGPMSFTVETNEGPVKWTTTPGGIRHSEVEAEWSAGMRADGLRAELDGRLDFTGSGEIAIRLTAGREIEVADIRLDIPWREDAATYQMGLGRTGGIRPPEAFDWTWDVRKRQDCLWMGEVNAGMMLRFKDDGYVRPLVNIYYDFLPLELPASWGNSGRGGISIGAAENGRVPVRAHSGARTLKAGETLSFVFELYLTPFRTLDTAQQWDVRFIHPNPSRDPATLKRVIETMDARSGPNVLNIHQAHAAAPFINYPYADAYEDQLTELVRMAHERKCRARIYYTTRELTQNLPELHALHSMNGEIIFPGPGPEARTLINRNGPHPWLVENLGDDFIPAWVDQIRRPEAEWDLSVITRPDSRWNNFYLEGLQRLTERLGFDGVYLDDTALDARSLRRARRILDRKPSRLMDFHTWNHMNAHAGFANNLTIYMELLPYFDRLWIGEGFSMQRSSDFILVEMSGLPFGVMSEMLDHPNPWRGLLYGMTTRLGWSGDPRPLWKAFDDYGIRDTEFIPYFSKRLPVKSGQPEVPVSVYQGRDRCWVAIASWAENVRSVIPEVDWTALGLSESRAAFYAPAIAGVQSEARFLPGQPIHVLPGRGRILILDETPREVAAGSDPLDGTTEALRDNFTAPQLAKGWWPRVSGQSDMRLACYSSALRITGAANRISGIERDLPAGTRAVEVDIEPDSDQGQTWGPGIALVWKNGQTAKLNWRAEDKQWGIFGAEGFRRVKGPSPADQSRTVRILLAEQEVWFQVKDGEEWVTVDVQSRRGREGDPAMVRLGKLAENGTWTDHRGVAGPEGAASLTNFRVLAR